MAHADWDGTSHCTGGDCRYNTWSQRPGVEITRTHGREETLSSSSTHKIKAGFLLLNRRRWRRSFKDDYGAFIERFQLLPRQPTAPPTAENSLNGLTFAVKDIFDVEGHVTGFGNPDWARTHDPAVRTAPAVLLLLEAGATCVGKTHMDEMAYSMEGENEHYGTPTNPAAYSRIPGGSSSGSAVAVAAKLVDFALGTDTGASVRIPAAFCGILGFRPSHGAVSTIGVVPMAQSFDTIGWFARDPQILYRVGHTLLQLSFMDSRQPRHMLIADDCFQLSEVPREKTANVVITTAEKLFGGKFVNHINLGEYIASNVPTLKIFKNEEIQNGLEIPTLNTLCNILLLVQRNEFKMNHGDWVNMVKPALGPRISHRVHAALETTNENIDLCMKVRDEARAALNNLLEDDRILVIPTAPGPPPSLNTKEDRLKDFCSKGSTLLSVAGMSGCCQVSIPIGKYDGYPIAISLIARHGADKFLLDTLLTIYDPLQKQLMIA